jgi:hypothetical protein
VRALLKRGIGDVAVRGVETGHGGCIDGRLASRCNLERNFHMLVPRGRGVRCGDPAVAVATRMAQVQRDRE